MAELSPLAAARSRMVTDAGGWAVFRPGEEIRCPARLSGGDFCAHQVCTLHSLSTGPVFVRAMDRPPYPTARSGGRIRLEHVRCSNHGWDVRGRSGHLLVLEVDPSATVESYR